MALHLQPLLIFLLCAWSPLSFLTTMGSRERGEGFLRSVLYGLAFPAAWVVWFVMNNHAAGRRAFQPPADQNEDPAPAQH